MFWGYWYEVREIVDSKWRVLFYFDWLRQMRSSIKIPETGSYVLREQGVYATSEVGAKSKVFNSVVLIRRKGDKNFGHGWETYYCCSVLM